MNVSMLVASVVDGGAVAGPGRGHRYPTYPAAPSTIMLAPAFSPAVSTCRRVQVEGIVDVRLYRRTDVAAAAPSDDVLSQSPEAPAHNPQ
jgi:hypothetical protein